MKYKIHVLLLSTYLLAAPMHAHAQIEPVQKIHMSHRVLQERMQKAHTPAQFTALAEYFVQEEQEYRAKATEEKAEWIRRNQNNVSIYAKYPRPSDSAKNLYEYYEYKADHSGKLARQYENAAHPQAESGNRNN